MSDNCYECGHSVEWGSGRYVIRVPADVQRGEEDNVADPDGEWLCAEWLNDGEDE